MYGPCFHPHPKGKYEQQQRGRAPRRPRAASLGRVMLLGLRRPGGALTSRVRMLCTPGSAHLAVMQVYRLQPAPVPPGLQPRLLFPEGQAHSAEESAAQLAEAAERGEVVLMTESALRRLLGGEGQAALGGGGGGGGSGGAFLLGDTSGEDGPGAEAARRAPAEPSAQAVAGGGGPGAAVALTDEGSLPAVLSRHSVALRDALAPSSAAPVDWGTTSAWQQGEAPPPQGAQLRLLHAAADGDVEALEARACICI